MGLRKNLLPVVLVLLSLGGGLLAPNISRASLVAVSTSMVGLAGVVVTVFGIWVAVIFPRLLSGLESGGTEKAEGDKERYDVLIASLYRSCFVLSADLFIFIIISFYSDDESGKFFIFSLVAFLWLSFFSVVDSLWSAISNGELAAVGAINRSGGIGLLRRLRRRGKSASRRESER